MEAAIVLPIIILAVITSVLIIMLFYMQMTEQCRLHRALRAEAGNMTSQTMYLSEVSTVKTEVDIYREKKASGGEVYGKKYIVMDHKGILDKKGTFVLEGRCHAVDGPSYVRYSSIIRGKRSE